MFEAHVLQRTDRRECPRRDSADRLDSRHVRGGRCENESEDGRVAPMYVVNGHRPMLISVFLHAGQPESTGTSAQDITRVRVKQTDSRILTQAAYQRR